tara:strand:+ start:451 stop:1320 length:870 start_codon:yes stop_codon:yes gene_type:complete
MKTLYRLYLLLIAFPLMASCHSAPKATSTDYTFTSDWFSPVIPLWEKTFASFAEKEDFKYLEVGVYEGRSFFWVLDHLARGKNAEVHALDVFPDKIFYTFSANSVLSKQTSKIHVHKGYSREVLPKLVNHKFDMIYIDGSHIAKNVMLDGLLAVELLNPGGYIIFDDYEMMPHLPLPLRPRHAINSFAIYNSNHLEITHRGRQVIFRKRNFQCPEILDNFVSQVHEHCYYWNQYQLKNTRKGLYDKRGRKISLSISEEKSLLSYLVRPSKNLKLPKRLKDLIWSTQSVD